jgi:hypothetical protein
MHLYRSIVVDRLRERFERRNDIGIGFIYCNYKQRDAQTLVNLVASLWAQLVHNRTALSHDAKELHATHVKTGTRPSLSNILNILQSEIGRLSKVYIIVDALDECHQDWTRDLITELRKLLPAVNLLVTSRPHDIIASMFKGASQLEVEANVEDVRAYVLGRISRSNQLSQHVATNPYLRDEILKGVVASARNMYVLRPHSQQGFMIH